MLRLFGRYLGRAYVDKTLDAVAPEDIEAYQRHLVTERKVGFSSFNQSTCALRFFYRTCLGKTDWTIARMPYQRKRRALPEILSPEEISAIFDACHNLKHQALLMTSYSGGLRLGETLGLLPSDIDSKRMMIRVEQGKGRKDRYVMLSPTLLRGAARLLEGIPPRALAVRGTQPGAAAVALHRREGLHHRRRSGRHPERASRSTRCATPSRPTSSRAAPTSA